MSKPNFIQKKYSDLVSRRDYARFHVDFEEPNLLEIQVDSYNRFLEEEIEPIIRNFFPVIHAKNNKYEVHYNKLKFVDPIRTEEQARNEGKTYEKPLYVDLSLINNETGEVKRVNKTKNNLSEGVFFANLPIMTEKGTFIINGIEKLVVSQIVRSPGAYILSKSQIKLATKKKINHGFICEVLPFRGTLINFYIDENTETLKASMRNSTGNSIYTFNATQLLKAFGMSQNEIRRIFKDDIYILNTLFNEPYNHQNILEQYEIMSMRKVFNETTDYQKQIATGSPIDMKLRSIVFEYEQENNKNVSLRQRYESLLEDYRNKKVSVDKVEEALDKLNVNEKRLVELKDIIITEKAAKDLITSLSISTRALEQNAFSNNNPICYQEVLVKHFMDVRQYDLTSAGRYKLDRKLRISERLYNRILGEDIIDKNDKVILPRGTLITKDQMDIIKDALSRKQLRILDELKLNVSTKIEDTQSKIVESISVYTDNEQQDAITPIIGTYKDNNVNTLTLVDFVSIMSYTVNLPHDIGTYDDIEHLGNKRLRLIHEQLKSKIQVGMSRVEKHIKEKLASISIATANDEQQAKVAAKTTVKSIVNTKAMQLIIKKFFNTYQLTQFVDQQNPLSELTNKRRISAMGDGGISREDPNLDIRDVHYSHYGRICPIETPEGMNIGLIMSLASFAKVDPNGFLITPYQRVRNGVVTKEIEWLTPLREYEYVISEGNVPYDIETDKIAVDKVVCRHRSTQELFPIEKVDFIEICPRQVVSVAASAIPFLEHDDTTRALMGANMQRQAVPLIHPIAPIIGTGTEYKIAHDSGLTVIAKEDGVVTHVDGQKVVITNKNQVERTYKLVKYNKSNQDTCINQTPIVALNQKIKAGDTLADGPAMYNGELALGRNPLVAFMTWYGYNFEDAVVISERLVRDDIYTSISIEEHVIECLRTKNGDEEITRDLPNVSDESKRYLDEDGIIMVGAEVKEGDILVGKVSPRAKAEYTPEEKLLQAIFGNRSKNFRESSLKLPNGGEGIVAKVQRFSMVNNDELGDDVIELVKVYVLQKRKIQIGDKMSGRHGNKGIVSIVVPIEDMPHMQDGTPIDILLNPLGVPSRMNIGQIFEIHLGYAMRKIAMKKAIEFSFDKKGATLMMNELGLKEAKAKLLFNAIKKYCKDKKLVDLDSALKHIKETELLLILKSLGLSYEDLNYKAATPVFAGADLNDIKQAFAEVNLDATKTLGKFQLYDGKTGEPFASETTVGVMYMMKLDHMVDDKIHARAVGPYSKITQQPLGGKSQNGGQRFGEMEVWALEAYGAAHNLRELLTIKSDDVKGRNLTYTSIVKGKPLPTPSLPQSFKLLTKQLQGLGLQINVIKTDNSVEDINNYTSVISDQELKEALGESEITTREVYENPYEKDLEENF